jgi:hypothetical protein
MPQTFINRNLFLVPKRTADRVIVIRTQNAPPPKKTRNGRKGREDHLPPAA